MERIAEREVWVGWIILTFMSLTVLEKRKKDLHYVLLQIREFYEKLKINALY